MERRNSRIRAYGKQWGRYGEGYELKRDSKETATGEWKSNGLKATEGVFVEESFYSATFAFCRVNKYGQGKTERPLLVERGLQREFHPPGRRRRSS